MKATWSDNEYALDSGGLIILKSENEYEEAIFRKWNALANDKRHFLRCGATAYLGPDKPRYQSLTLSFLTKE